MHKMKCNYNERNVKKANIMDEIDELSDVNLYNNASWHSIVEASAVDQQEVV